MKGVGSDLAPFFWEGAPLVSLGEACRRFGSGHVPEQKFLGAVFIRPFSRGMGQTTASAPSC
jgi:hypothetical protein